MSWCRAAHPPAHPAVLVHPPSPPRCPSRCHPDKLKQFDEGRKAHQAALALQEKQDQEVRGGGIMGSEGNRGLSKGVGG